jgi:1-acyl-sn-glycerol-3-phosphate acyltransferase
VGVAAALHGREVRPLLEDAVFHFPFLGVLVNRLGAVRACPENAERLLSRGSAVAVFPEGAGGCAKPFRERYRVQRFGRGGFVRLALRTGATIVPVAVVGSEETYPILGRVPARPLGVPFLPITPTWPWLGPAGLWPLPTKWTIELGEPVDLAGLGPADANDDARVMRIAEGVRTTVQAMLDARLAERTGVFADGRAR